MKSIALCFLIAVCLCRAALAADLEISEQGAFLIAKVTPPMKETDEWAVRKSSVSGVCVSSGARSSVVIQALGEKADVVGTAWYELPVSSLSREEALDVFARIVTILSGAKTGPGGSDSRVEDSGEFIVIQHRQDMGDGYSSWAIRKSAVKLVGMRHGQTRATLTIRTLNNFREEQKMVDEKYETFALDPKVIEDMYRKIMAILSKE